MASRKKGVILTVGIIAFGAALTLFLLSNSGPRADNLGAAPARIIVTTLYATNRDSQNLSGRREAYGPSRSNQLSYGEAEVSVPITHRVGDLELPPFSILEQRLKMPRQPRDFASQFGLLSVKPMQEEAVISNRHGSFSTSPAEPQNLFIFVPGRSASFNETAFRTAQLAYDLKLEGREMFFSWPALSTSDEGLMSYVYDADSAEISQPYLVRVFDRLATLKYLKLTILGNGMGAKLAVTALNDWIERGGKFQTLCNLILVAPDIDSELFLLAVRKASGGPANVHITVYNNAADRETRIAKLIHGGLPRLGETLGGVISTTNFDLVVFPESESWRSRLEFYQDLKKLVETNATPSQRGLQRRGEEGKYYWEFNTR